MEVIYSDNLLYCGGGIRHRKFEECWVRILFPVQVLIKPGPKVHLLSNIRNKCSARKNYKHYRNLSLPYNFPYKDLHKINEPHKTFQRCQKNSPKLQRVSSVRYYYRNKEHFLFSKKSASVSLKGISSSSFLVSFILTSMKNYFDLKQT